MKLKILGFLFLFFAGGLLFAGSTISDHLTELDGIQKSIESAEEEMTGLKTKLREEKSLDKRSLIKKDIDGLNKSIKMFKELEQKVTNHVMLEHSKKDRLEFKKNLANRQRMRQRSGASGHPAEKRKWP
jgi:hypothetical protein